MTPIHAIMVLIIRLWAADAIISMIIIIPKFLLYSGDYYSEQNVVLIATSSLHVIVWLAAGVTAWVVAPKLARLVYPAVSDRDVKIEVDAEQLVMIGSFLIGGYYLVQYVPEMFVSLGAVLIEIRHAEPVPFGEPQKELVTTYSAQEFYSDASVIVVAAWMAFRPAHISRIFSWLRSAGHYDHSHDKLEKTPENSQ